MIEAKLVDHNGSPAIKIGDRFFPPMTATVTTCKARFGEYGRIIDKDYFKALGDAGIKIFYVMCNNLGLDDNAIEDFATEAKALFEAVPDAYIMVRFCLHPSEEWCENNPDEMVQYTDGREIPTLLTAESFHVHLKGMPSLCSQKWRDEMGVTMVETIKKLKALPYGDRIIGIFLAGGGTSEWYYINPIEDFSNGAYGDISPSFKREFQKFLDEKYGDGAKEVVIPNADARFYTEEVDYALSRPKRFHATMPVPPPPLNGTNHGVFCDFETNENTFDFYSAWHRGTANTIIHFARLVKENFPGTLVGSFFGAVGSSEVVRGGNATNVLRVLDSGYVDFLANPGVYENRQPGGFTGQRQCPDSYRLRNTMYIVEDDTRTCSENAFYAGRYCIFNEKDTIDILKRDFGRNICEDLQSWWFDQIVGGKRYKYPNVYKLFEKQQKIGQLAYSLDRKKNSEIAFVCDEESIVAVSKHTTHECIEQFRSYEIANIGAPVDSYFHNDLANPDMPDYKLYIFANCMYLSDKEREEIKAKLRKNGATALFLYGGGIINPDKKVKYNPENMTDLLGFKCSELLEVHSPLFRFDEGAHSITKDLDSAEFYGAFLKRRWGHEAFVGEGYMPPQLCPMIYPDDESCTVLAHFLSNEKPAVAYKENDGYNAIYFGAKYITADVVREFARYAGCHIYEESGHVLHVNKNFLTLHAAHSGEVNIKLPKKCTPFELYEEKNYGENTDILTFNIKKGQTKMFHLK